MGMFKHHVIVVTCQYPEVMERIVKKATSTGLQTLGPVKSPVNGLYTLLIPPDGSKEEWPESPHGDAARTGFIRWLTTLRHEDGSSPVEWFEATYGADIDSAYVTAHEWQKTKPTNSGAELLNEINRLAAQLSDMDAFNLRREELVYLGPTVCSDDFVAAKKNLELKTKLISLALRLDDIGFATEGDVARDIADEL